MKQSLSMEQTLFSKDMEIFERSMDLELEIFRKDLEIFRLKFQLGLNNRYTGIGYGAKHIDWREYLEWRKDVWIMRAKEGAPPRPPPRAASVDGISLRGPHTGVTPHTVNEAFGSFVLFLFLQPLTSQFFVFGAADLDRAEFKEEQARRDQKDAESVPPSPV